MALVVALSLAPPVSATMLEGGTWQEDNDAGKTLSAAQVILGSGLIQIDGVLGADASDNVDLFKIRSASATQAETVLLEAFILTDTGTDAVQLFLFDAAGFGVKASNSTSEPAFAVDVAPNTVFYLGISMAAFLPRDSGDNNLFDLDGNMLTAGALDNWNDGAVPDPPFQIGLINAQPFGPAAQVPEPATLVLLGSVLTALGAIALRRRR